MYALAKIWPNPGEEDLAAVRGAAFAVLRAGRLAAGRRAGGVF